MLLLTVIVFIIMLLALVLVHEFGHFIVAKWAGCGVKEFAFGFPPRLFSFVHGGTRYAFNLLPLGGYVKIEGEDMNEANPSPTSFAGKSAPWRIFILSAGVMMNVVLAVVLLGVQAGIGVPTLATDETIGQLHDVRTYIIEVLPGSPAEQAGIQPLDRVVSVGSVSQPSIEQLQAIVAEQAGQELVMEIESRGIHEMITLMPRVNPPVDEGAMGVVLQAAGLKKVVWWQAPWTGIKRTGQMLSAIAVQFWLLLQRLVSEGTVGDVLSGPVAIAIYTNEVTTMGASYVLEFAALISLNLAIINILPFPALDGGRILFIGIEIITRRRLPARIEHLAHLTGFALLIALMLFVTFKDIERFF